MSVDEVVDDIWGLYKKFGDDDYLGEAISKSVHAIQCGALAEQNKESVAIVLGAFLHDVGHFVGVRDGKAEMRMGETMLGADNHAALGAEFLTRLGFPVQVTDVVRHHVDAKRYLCFKRPAYLNNLSWASQKTLELQGGPMTEAEAREFETQPLFPAIIRCRQWDEAGKDPNWTDLPSLDHFKELATAFLRGLRSQ